MRMRGMAREYRCQGFGSQVIGHRDGALTRLPEWSGCTLASSATSVMPRARVPGPECWPVNRDTGAAGELPKFLDKARSPFWPQMHAVQAANSER